MKRDGMLDDDEFKAAKAELLQVKGKPAGDDGLNEPLLKYSK